MSPKERINLIEVIACHLQDNYKTTQINQLLGGYGVVCTNTSSVNSKRIYVSEMLGPQTNEMIIQLAQDLGLDIPQATAHKKYQPVSSGTTAVAPTNPAPVPQTPHDTARKVFVSHSSQDKDLVEKMIDLLRVMGVNPDRIFCSSFEGYGINLGENFLDALKRELSKDVLVIFVLSRNFYDSPICLCEMGAAWVTTREHVPVLIPPFGFRDVQGVFPHTQGMTINDKAKLNALKEEMEQFFDLNPIRHSIWERDRDNILSGIEQRLSVRT